MTTTNTPIASSDAPSVTIKTYEQGLAALDTIEGKDAAPEVKQVLTQLRHFFGDRIAKARPVEKPEDARERAIRDDVTTFNRDRFKPKALPDRAEPPERKPIGVK